MKQGFITIIGAIGAYVANLFGGWDAGLSTLVIFMAIDYITGLIVAGVFHTSPKTETGALQSKAGLRGLCKKGMVLLVVLVAVRLDVLIGTAYVRDATIIAFCVNEVISIIENAGLMGINLPAPIRNALDILQKKGNGGGEDD